MRPSAWTDMDSGKYFSKAATESGRIRAGGGGGQVAHTLTACCRCRQRKTRCDAGLPRCGPCERTNAYCEYLDAAKGKKMPRHYVVFLQDRVKRLEAELASLSEEQGTDLDAEDLVRSAGLVRIKENDESRFLGPSSGIAMTRLVIELVKDLCNVKKINEIVPAAQARQIRERFAKEASKPTSKLYPEVSSVAAPGLPSRELTDMLIDNFNLKAQHLYPVLHEPSFRHVVGDVYEGSKDAYSNFSIRIVIAISMHKLDPQWTGLADSYYLAALQWLEAAIRPKNLGTLQCFALIAEYSMVTPTRTAAFWAVGLAVKLCQELGLTDEATITCDKNGKPLNALEVDLRRRAFWTIMTFEMGLAHALGRPSALGITHEHYDVGWFSLVDDEFITSSGVLPRSPVSSKKVIAQHFFKMRLLQLEVRRTLYLKKRATPVDDSDPWFTRMETKMNDWIDTCPKSGNGTGLGEIWYLNSALYEANPNDRNRFKVRYHTMIVFLFRPSPQVPEPSVRAARLCFDASKFNIYVQKDQMDKRTVDLTWIFTQSLFMAFNTVLWTISYSEIRKEHPRSEVETILNTALEATYLASLRWPGVEAAFELYSTLMQACLKAYEGHDDVSYSIGPPSTSTTSPRRADPLTPSPTPPIFHRTLLQSQAPSSFDTPPSPVPSSRASNTSSNGSCASQYTHDFVAARSMSPHASLTAKSPSPGNFDPMLHTNPLPTPLSYGFDAASGNIFTAPYSQQFLFSTLGQQYTQHMQAQSMPFGQMNGLNLQQQSELMNKLETRRIYGMFDNSCDG